MNLRRPEFPVLLSCDTLARPESVAYIDNHVVDEARFNEIGNRNIEDRRAAHIQDRVYKTLRIHHTLEIVNEKIIRLYILQIRYDLIPN